MECNKDDAVKAKELAEKKFAEKNYASAKKFVLKALNLYPELEGLSQMLTILDVYISSENKINGEADWYGVLSVTPYTDDETIKKQYRKLAFMLHPDKNKSFGAEGAFKLVSEAWSLLSDKAKRVACNHKRNVQGFQQEAASRTGGPSVQPSASTFQNSMNSVRKTVKTSQQEAAHCSGGPSTQPSASTFQNVMNAKTQQPSATTFQNVTNAKTKQHSATTFQNVMNARTQHGPTLITSYAKAATFWTVCNHCKTHYQYVRMYLRHLLVCPNCRNTFLAVELAPPAELFKASKSSSSRQHQNSRQHAAAGNSNSSGRHCAATQNVGAGGSLGPNSNNNTNLNQGSISKMTSISSTVASGHVAVDGGQQTSENVKRDAERRQSIAEWERSQNLNGNPSLKRRRMDDPHLNGYDKNKANQMSMGNGGADLGAISELSKGNAGTKRIYGFSSTYDRPKVLREVPYPVIKKALVVMALTSIRNFLERSSATEAKQANKEQETVKVNKKQKSVGNVDTSTNSGPNVEDKSPMPINVPDPDFHNFDLDRTERSFREDQVWAAYDDDGMPRYYARIQKVISLRPFKMRISWLNSRSNNELGPLNWVGSGFAKTCGDFRPGKYEISGTLNSFSSKVNWTKGTRGVIRVFPTKGEIWALYRNWSPDWNQHTPDAVINKYDMVELLDDFTEEHGVSVAPLSKVAGFKTVFRKHTDPKEVKRIPKEEMFRFSHLVPSLLLTGEEAYNAPMDCWELDPAALPSELYQVITEVHDAPMKQNDVKTDEEIPKPQPMMTDDSGACQVGQGN